MMINRQQPFPASYFHMLLPIGVVGLHPCQADAPVVRWHSCKGSLFPYRSPVRSRPAQASLFVAFQCLVLGVTYQLSYLFAGLSLVTSRRLLALHPLASCGTTPARYDLHTHVKLLQPFQGFLRDIDGKVGLSPFAPLRGSLQR